MNDKWTNKLPDYEPENSSWQRISDRMDIDEWVNVKAENLPFHQPANSTWQNIEIELNTSEKKPVFKITKRRNYWIAAASVLIFLTIGWWIISPKENVQISYSTELIKDVNTNVKSADLRVIDERCEELVAVCNRLEVKDLRKEIEALSDESATIEEQVKVFGDDPTLINAQRKIETKKAEMVQQLLAMMNHETNS